MDVANENRQFIHLCQRYSLACQTPMVHSFNNILTVYYSKLLLMKLQGLSLIENHENPILVDKTCHDMKRRDRELQSLIVCEVAKCRSFFATITSSK